jgi:hypothetical protein
MILEYDPPVSKYHEGESAPHMVGYISPWDKGTCDVVLNVGHGEYPVEIGEVVWDCGDDENPIRKIDLAPLLVRNDEYEGLWYDHDLFAWGTLVRYTGPVFALAKEFYRFSTTVDPEFDPADYTPGGDDDSFDYYPSAIRVLYEMALDLTTMTGHERYLNRYRAVIRNVIATAGPVDEWEFDAPLLDEILQEVK